MGEDAELLALLLSVRRVHVGREWSLFHWPDRCAAAAHGRLQRARDLARRPPAPAGDAEPAPDEAGLRRQRPPVPRARVPDRLVPRCRRPAETGLRQDPRGCSSARPTTSSTRITSRSATSPGSPCELSQLTERFGELCVDAAEHTDAKIVYELMPFDTNVTQPRQRARGRRRRRRTERRHRDRHLAHVQARHRARRPSAHPARVPLAGSS